MNAPDSYRAYLILQESGQQYPLDPELTTIGRKSGNSIVLNEDLKVSRHHATISRDGEAYILHDVGSANGTFVNDRRLTEPHTLAAGDIIRIGASRFEVHLVDEETEPSLLPPVIEAGGGPTPAAAETGEFETLPNSPDDIEINVATTEATQLISGENPYVGPRTFTQEEADRFFGREREARELVSLIISNRLVLFYAQSGAGKSSLINARLIPNLRQAGKAVLPIGRVSGALPEGVTGVENIYLFNLLLSLDESDGDARRFTEMTLATFLQHLTSLDGKHYFYDEAIEEEVAAEDEFEDLTYILIIDQFEEIITTHAERWQEREQFFEQLAGAMEADPLLWVVLSMREDYVAALDPYMHLMPDHLRARFYMQRMTYDAALEAVEKPALKFGRPFAPGAAETLVDNLRQIRVGGQTPGQIRTQPGQFVEPVQLQVVCYQLWENLKNRPPGLVTEQDLRELGDVDEALAQFYEHALAEVIDRTGVSEIELRNWFETELITEIGTRGTVYRGKRETGGIPNKAVDQLVNHFLLRSEARTGGTWYELVHDRFVTPILQSNQAWRLEQPLIQLAQDWKESERSPGKLIGGQTLDDALESNWRGLGPSVEEFLAASQAAQRRKEEAERREKEQQRQRELEQAKALAEKQQELLTVQSEANEKLRRRAWLLGAFVLAAVAMAAFAITFGLWANQSATEARDARDIAQEQATAAAANANEARMLLEAQKATQTAMAEMDMMDEERAMLAQELDATATSLEATATAAAEAEMGAMRTATAQYAPDTPTWTPPPPTHTPTGTFTPPPTDTPTPTPTLTPPPTPHSAATATAEALAAEISELRQQQQDLAAPLPVELSESGCMPEPEGAFADIWAEFQGRLGCPLQANPVGGNFAEQPFQRGVMFWSQILELFFVLEGNVAQGTWQVFTKAQVEGFNPEGLEQPCQIETPPGLVHPVRGFGSIWCANPEIQEALGFGLQPEYGVQNNQIQEFERGYIIRDSDNLVYVLFGDDNTYRRGR